MKAFKKYAAILSVAILMVCMVFLLGSCDDLFGSEKTYEVQLVDQYGNPVVGANVEFSSIETGMVANVDTDENGRAKHVSKSKDVFTVNVLSVPSGYVFNPKDNAERIEVDGELPYTINIYKYTNYTVTVKDQNGAAVPGASITLSINGTEVEEKLTDASGKVSFLTNPGVVVKALVNSVPDGYDIGDTSVYTFDANATDLVIDGAVKLVDYKIVVKDQFGNVVEGANVQVCAITASGSTGVCATPIDTDENGVAIFAMKPAAGFKAQINSVPEGYAITSETATYAEGETEITIEVAKFVTYTVTVSDDAGAKVPEASVVLTVDEETYKAVKTDENGVASFTVAPGAVVVAKITAPKGYTARPDEFTLDATDGNTAIAATLLKDTTYSITVKDQNNDATAGVTVTFTVDGAKQKDVKTDKNGVASITIAPASDSVKVTVKAPKNYDFDVKEYTIDIKNGKTQVAVTSIKYTRYTITINSANGGVVPGATVMFSIDGVQKDGVLTDKNGVAFILLRDAAKTSVTATVEVPLGYTVTDTDYTIDIANNKTSATVEAVLDTAPETEAKEKLAAMLADLSTAQVEIKGTSNMSYSMMGIFDIEQQQTMYQAIKNGNVLFEDRNVSTTTMAGEKMMDLSILTRTIQIGTNFFVSNRTVEYDYASEYGTTEGMNAIVTATQDDIDEYNERIFGEDSSAVQSLLIFRSVTVSEGENGGYVYACVGLTAEGEEKFESILNNMLASMNLAGSGIDGVKYDFDPDSVKYDFVVNAEGLIESATIEYLVTISLTMDMGSGPQTMDIPVTSVGSVTYDYDLSDVEIVAPDTNDNSEYPWYVIPWEQLFPPEEEEQ